MRRDNITSVKGKRLDKTRSTLIENLEPRRLLAAVAWDGGGDGTTWADKNNWSNNLVPTTNDDVTINVAANPVIEIVGLQSIKSLNSSEKLHVAIGGDLRLAASSTINADLQVDASFRSNQTLTLNANLLIGNVSGTLNGQVFIGNGTATAQFINGNGAIVFGGSTSGNILYNNTSGSDAAGTMTIGPNITVRGFGGRLANNYSSGTIVNQGLITSFEAGGAISVGSSTGKLKNEGTIQAIGDANVFVNSNWTNAGVLNADGGTLNLGGTFTNASVGNVQRNSPGKVVITGAVNGGLNLDGVQWYLSNAIFTGGTINLINNARLFATASGSTLDNVTYNGTLDIAAVDGAKITVKNNLTLNGLILIGGSQTLGSLFFGSGQNTAQSLNGNCEIRFGSDVASAIPNNAIMNDSTGAGAAGTLTFGNSVFIHGRDGVIANKLATATTVNNGIIAADIGETTIKIPNVGTFKNQGMLEAVPGTIQFDGAYSNVDGKMTIGFAGGLAGVSYGLFKIGGAFTAGGTVNTVRLGNYSPANNAAHAPITYASQSGSFATTRLDSGNGISFQPTVGATSTTFKAITGGPTFTNQTGNKLAINGTINPDTINISREFDILLVTQNGATSVFRDPELVAIDIDSGNGGDTITVTAGPLNSVKAGDGNDTINVKDGRAEKIDGGPGSDTAVIDISDTLTDVEIVRGGSISGKFFNDSNSNGVKDGADVFLDNWNAYLDMNNNNTFDAGDFFKTSDATGTYLFRGVPDGTYFVRQIFQYGFRKTLPGAGIQGYTQVISAGGSATGKDFGDTTNILLAGKVFNDANNNGAQDAGEAVMPGITINIFSNNVLITTRTTDANGAWRVQGLAAGTGDLFAVIPAGYVATSPANAHYSGTMTSGQQNANLNIGLHKTSPAPLASQIRSGAIAKQSTAIWSTPLLVDEKDGIG